MLINMSHVLAAIKFKFKEFLSKENCFYKGLIVVQFIERDCYVK